MLMGSNSDEGTTFMNGESPFVLKTLNLLLQMLDFVSNKCWIFEQMLDFRTNVGFSIKCWIFEQMLDFRTNVGFSNKCWILQLMFDPAR